MALSSHNKCTQAPRLFKTLYTKLSCNLVLVENWGGLNGLIIGVRFQVGKSISGVFYGREREQQQGVVASYVVLPTSSPPGLCEHSPFSMIINGDGRGRGL